MRKLNAQIRQKSGTESRVENLDARLSTYAVYGALLIIATIVFGTLPFRPF